MKWQVKLLNRYYDLFNEYGIACGQVLTTKESLSTRRQYLNQRNCMETMPANGVLPIVNENDTISVTELMFTDNDELSGLVAAMMNAEALIILSNIDGIYDGPPSDPASQVIRRVKPSEDLSQYIDPVRSSRGRGGMATKSRVSSRAAAEGIEVIIANGRRDNILTDLILTDRDVVCTRFEAAPRPASGVKKWIASSEGFAKGILHIDQGAAAAVHPLGAGDGYEHVHRILPLFTRYRGLPHPTGFPCPPVRYPHPPPARGTSGPRG